MPTSVQFFGWVSRNWKIFCPITVYILPDKCTPTATYYYKPLFFKWHVPSVRSIRSCIAETPSFYMMILVRTKPRTLCSAYTSGKMSTFSPTTAAVNSSIQKQQTQHHQQKSLTLTRVIVINTEQWELLPFSSITAETDNYGRRFRGNRTFQKPWLPSSPEHSPSSYLWVFYFLIWTDLQNVIMATWPLYTTYRRGYLLCDSVSGLNQHHTNFPIEVMYRTVLVQTLMGARGRQRRGKGGKGRCLTETEETERQSVSAVAYGYAVAAGSYNNLSSAINGLPVYSYNRCFKFLLLLFYFSLSWARLVVLPLVGWR